MTAPTRRFASSAGGALLWLLLLIPQPPLAAPPGRPAYAEGWIVVKLRTALPRAPGRATYPRETGRPVLDAWLELRDVVRIDDALQVSARAPGDPGRLRRHGLDRTYRFHVPPGTDVERLAAELEQLDAVERAQPDWVGHGAALVPDDPRLGGQWALDRVNATGAWEIATGGGTVIAVLDTGVDSDHEDLADRLLAGYDFVNDDADPEDDHGHGTNVASIAAASTDNGVGVAGACWDCRILPLKVMDASNSGLYSWWADALVYAADHGARVVNLSGGGLAESGLLLDAVGYAYDAGVIQVSATHNDDAALVRYPARYAATLAVGATDQNDRRVAPFCFSPTSGSNYGPQIDVVAPGEEIDGAALGGGYGTLCGTSQATPLVAGLAALVRSAHPAVGREEARFLIRAGAEDQVGDAAEDTPGFDVYHGWGRVDMQRTVAAAHSMTTLRVEGKNATRVHLEGANPVAQSWDFVRGDLGRLLETPGGVGLGELACIENDSPDADTAGDEDGETPAPGTGFFYLARFAAAPGPGSYGGSSTNRDRAATALMWTRGGGIADAALGRSVAGAGDVDGDGYDDVLVGLPGYGGDLAEEGAAMLFRGSPSGPLAVPDWFVEGDQADAGFGWSVAGAGDVDGDGYDDVLVGAPFHDVDLFDEGRVYLYLGSATGLSTAPAWVLDGDQLGAQLGYSVAGAGDVNMDDRDDVIVGEYLYDNLYFDRGRARVFEGAPGGLELTAAWTSDGPEQSNGWFGQAVAGAGDVDNDGYDDVIVGGPRVDNGQIDEGVAWVFHGSAAGLSPVAATMLENDVENARFGSSVAGVGHVDGDVYGDVIVGAVRPATGEGAVFVYPGSAAGVQTGASWSFLGDGSAESLGESVAGAGDVNLDGYADVIVGAPEHDGLRAGEGRVLLFLGSAGGLAADPIWSRPGGGAGAGFGGAVAGAGDVDQDGAADVIVGAPGFSDAAPDEGLAFVFRGPVAGAGDCPP